MTTKLDLAAVALRQTPTLRFEGPFLIQKGPYPYVAIFYGRVKYWREDGRGAICSDQPDDLVPFRAPLKVLRFWSKVEDDMTYLDTQRKTSKGWREMIERAPAENLADAVELHIKKHRGYPAHPLASAIREYRAMYPKEETK